MPGDDRAGPGDIDPGVAVVVVGEFRYRGQGAAVAVKIDALLDAIAEDIIPELDAEIKISVSSRAWASRKCTRAVWPQNLIVFEIKN